VLEASRRNVNALSYCLPVFRVAKIVNCVCTQVLTSFPSSFSNLTDCHLSVRHLVMLPVRQANRILATHLIFTYLRKMSQKKT